MAREIWQGLHSRRLGFGLVLAVGIGITTYALLHNRRFYHDDAYISLRYARNFIEGKGLVWNPGERVEGYTNFLYILLAAWLGRLGLELVAASRLVSALAFSALIGILARLLARADGTPLWRNGSVWSLVALVDVLCSFPLLLWVLGGLEAPLFALWCALAVGSVGQGLERGLDRKRAAASGFWLALACMTRPDGIVFLAVSAVFVLSSPGPHRLQRVMALAGTFAVTLAPYLLWKVANYGSMLPNTYHVKLAGPAAARLDYAWRYLGSFLNSPPFLALTTFAAVLCSVSRRGVDRPMAYLVTIHIAYLAYVSWIGGDHMLGYRLFAPLIPLSALLLAHSLRRLIPRPRPQLAIPVCVGVLVAVSLQASRRNTNPGKQDPAAFVGTIVGRYIASAWPESSLVALNTAGSTPYHAPAHRYIDMLGLNDAQIARRPVAALQLPWQQVPGHAKGDGAYVLSREPDYIILGPSEGQPSPGRLPVPVEMPWFLSDLEMSLAPRFAARYEMHQEKLDAKWAAGWQQYAATASGTLLFTFYGKKTAPAEAPAPQRR